MLWQQIPILSDLDHQDVVLTSSRWARLVHSVQIRRVCRHVSVHKVGNLQQVPKSGQCSSIIDNSCKHMNATCSGTICGGEGLVGNANHLLCLLLSVDFNKKKNLRFHAGDLPSLPYTLPHGM